MSGKIYIHINKTNGKVYVGQTINVERRWRSRYKYKQPYIRKAVLKYGWGGFDHIVVVEDIQTQEELNNLERLWIIVLNSTGRNNGYNLVPGGLQGSSALGRLGGIASNKNPENRNRLNKLRTFESCSLGGQRGGKKNVESGQAKKIGYAQGKINKDNGHWDRIRLLGNKFDANWGHKQGLKNIESGHLKKLNHYQWHVSRNIFNPHCSLCEVEADRLGEDYGGREEGQASQI